MSSVLFRASKRENVRGGFLLPLPGNIYIHDFASTSALSGRIENEPPSKALSSAKNDASAIFLVKNCSNGKFNDNLSETKSRQKLQVSVAKTRNLLRFKSADHTKTRL